MQGETRREPHPRPPGGGHILNLPLIPFLMPDITIDAATLATLRAMTANAGIEKTAKAIGVSRDTLLRILASLPVRKGTVLLILESLKNIAKTP